MAAEPFSSSVLLRDDALRFESAASCGARLLLGAADGTLVVCAPSGSGSDRYDILETRRQFAPRAIVALEAHERLDLLVVLSDGLVHVHALGDLRRLSVLNMLRGVGVLALTRASDAGDCLLAVSRGAKAHVLRWAPSARAFVDVAEVGVPDGAVGGGGGGGGTVAPHLKAAVSHLTDVVSDAVSTVAKETCAAAVFGAAAAFGGAASASVVAGGGPIGGGGSASGTLATLLLWLADADGARELIIGTRREYLRFEIGARRLVPLFKTARAGGTAVGARVGRGEALLCQERIGCFVGLGGEPSRKFQLSFRDPPAIVCASGDFLLSAAPPPSPPTLATTPTAARAQSAGTTRPSAREVGTAAGGNGSMGISMEVRLLQTQDVMQTLALPPLGAAGLAPACVCAHAGDSDGGGGDDGARGDGDGARACVDQLPHMVVVANGGSVVALRPLPLLELQRRLVAARRFDEATALCASAHGAGTRAAAYARRAIAQLHAFSSLHERRFDAACAALSDAHARPLDVLSLYPKLLPAGVAPRAVVVELAPAGRVERVAGADGPARAYLPVRVQPLELADEAQIVALYSSLRGFLERARRQPELLLPPPPSGRAATGADARDGLVRPVHGARAQDGELTDAEREAELVACDSALLKVLLSIDQPAIFPFLRQPNACALNEAESILLRYRQIHELVGLWQGRGMHAKALELLASIGQRHAFATGAAGTAGAAACAQTGLDDAQTVAFGGTRATVEYLRGLRAAELELIFKYSAWPLRADPDGALRIFCDPHDGGRRGGDAAGARGEPRARRGGALPPDAVYDHICALASPQLGLRYLEAVLITAPGASATGAAGGTCNMSDGLPNGADAGSARLHDELARGLLAHVERLCAELHELQCAAPAAEPTNARVVAAPHATAKPRAAASAIASELAAVRARFAAIVRRSRKVGTEHLLAQITTVDGVRAGASPAGARARALAPERTLLLRKLGRHEAALRLLVYELGDMEGAHAYCATVAVEEQRVGLDDTAAAEPAPPLRAAAAAQPPTHRQSTYDHLVRVLLRPADGRAADVPAALALVRAHAEEVDPYCALELLPAHVPIATLAEWLHASLRALEARGRAAQVARNLLKADSLAVRGALGEARREQVVLEPDTPCAVCGKRIGTAAFARYPNAVVAHLVCSADSVHVCPVTREDFRRRALSAGLTRG